MIFALGFPVLGAAVAAAIDLNTWFAAQQRLQKAADGAALAAAREFQLATATAGTISRIAEEYLRSNLAERGPAPAQVTATASTTTRMLRIDVTAEVSPILSRIISDQVKFVSASSTAKLSGSAPICVIGLDPKEPGTLHFEKDAQLTAHRCAVQSNSSSPKGLQGEDKSVWD